MLEAPGIDAMSFEVVRVKRDWGKLPANRTCFLAALQPPQTSWGPEARKPTSTLPYPSLGARSIPRLCCLFISFSTYLLGMVGCLEVQFGASFKFSVLRHDPYCLIH